MLPLAECWASVVTAKEKAQRGVVTPGPTLARLATRSIANFDCNGQSRKRRAREGATKNRNNFLNSVQVGFSFGKLTLIYS